MEKHTYKVIGKNFRLITSVFAENDQEAKKEAARTLSRPGRYYILQQWQEDGGMVVTEEMYSDYVSNLLARAEKVRKAREQS